MKLSKVDYYELILKQISNHYVWRDSNGDLVVSYGAKRLAEDALQKYEYEEDEDESQAD